MNDRHPPRMTLLPGRWQPLHEGHKVLVRVLLAEGRRVVIGVFDTPPSDRNPYTLDQRRAMIDEAFTAEIADGRVSVLALPWCDEVAYGRECGWRARKLAIDPDIERQYSGTALRRQGDAP